MKMKHDNLWRANPDTAEEMDEIERRRKRAMRTAITLLALAVAVNVAVNEFSCVGPSPSKRDAAPAVQQSAPDDRGGAGQAGADADGEEPALSLDIAPDQAEATRVDQDAVRAALGAYCRRRASRRLARTFRPCSASRRRPPRPTWRWSCWIPTARKRPT